MKNNLRELRLFVYRNQDRIQSDEKALLDEATEEYKKVSEEIYERIKAKCMTFAYARRLSAHIAKFPEERREKIIKEKVLHCE